MQVILRNKALETQDERAGIYTEYQMVNGKMSWKSGDNAIWFIPKLNSWGIGSKRHIGSDVWGIGSSDGTGYRCPYEIPG